MKAFLAGILAELAAMKPADYAEPDSPVQDGEEELGELPDELKALYTLKCKRADALYRVCESQHDIMLAALTQDGTEDQFLESVKPMALHIMEHKRQSLIDEMFWQGVKELHPAKILFAQADGRAIGMRKDWKVVIAAPSKAEGIAIEISSLDLTSILGGRRRGGIFDGLFGSRLFGSQGIFGR